MRPYPNLDTDSGDSATVADYIVTALSPALIMGLVGSLVYFLAEIFYAGRYESRLLYTLFCYVFGIVLVARISIVVDPTRSAAYGLCLTGVCYVALLAYVRYDSNGIVGKLAPVINLFLMLVVWWCAQKLTRDCTHIDERRESSDRGLLSAVGFEGKTALEPDEEIVIEENAGKGKHQAGWWERYREHRRLKELKPHTPGTTVIYFSLAALPIFGLGQSLIPAADGGRRHFAFLLAAVYVACAMGLLLTTSFLGVRRYLRQRHLKMPASMTGIWLGLGAAFIAGFIVVATFLPRPYSETPLVKLDFLKSTSKEREASKHAVMKDGESGKGEGQSGRETKAGDGNATAKKGQPGGKGQSGDAKQGSGENNGKNGSENSSSKGKEGGDSREDSEGANRKDGEQKGRPSQNREPRDSQAGAKAGDSKGDSANEDTTGDSLKDFQASKIGGLVNSLANLLKWIVFALVLLVVLLVICYFFLRNIAPFTTWAQRLLAKWQAFWSSLFNSTADARPAVEEPVVEQRITFAQYSNPFEDGTAGSRGDDGLIRYTFAALEAWAGDRGADRRKDETPFEFAERLQTAFPDIENQAGKLASLLVRLEYGPGELPGNAKDRLRQVWSRLSS